MNPETLQHLVRILKPTTLDSTALLDRLLTQRDPDAFAALVHEHAAIVWRACRRVLPESECDEVFQATFLVLWQQAHRIRRATSLSCWLHGVAYRLALRQHTANTRRRRREQRAARPEVTPDISMREACQILHEEIQQLPPKYRDVLVLCHLEGHTRDEAAHELGLSLNAVRGALERGRDQLRERLEKRGVAWSAALLTLAAGDSFATPTPALVQHVLAHTPSVHPLGATWFGTKWFAGLAMATLIVVGVYAWLGGTTQTVPTTTKDTVTKPVPSSYEYRGQVVDAKGQPVAGAKIYLHYFTREPNAAVERAVTDKNGHYRFTVEPKDFKTDFYAQPWQNATLLAKADGHAVSWIVGNQPRIELATTTEITGRFVNLEGQPLAGVQVRVVGVLRPKTANLDAFLKELDDTKEEHADLRAEFKHLQGFDRDWLGAELQAHFPTMKCDAKGHFRIVGLAPETIVELEARGPNLERTRLKVLTRNVGVPAVKNRQTTYHANGSTWPLGPGRTITGVVTDAVTGKPVANAYVFQFALNGLDRRNSSLAPCDPVRTDAEGKYTYTGVPMRPNRQGALVATGPRGSVYLPEPARIPEADGLKPGTMNFQLTEGTLATVKAINKQTRQPLKGIVHFATHGSGTKPGRVVTFFAHPNAPFVNTTDDGYTWQIVLPRMKGQLCFRADASTSILEARNEIPFDDASLGWMDRLETHPSFLTNRIPHHFESVETKDDQKTLDLTLEVDPGQKIPGKVVVPAGQAWPASATITGLRPFPFHDQSLPLATGDFSVFGLREKEKRLIVVQCPKENLAGFLLAEQGKPAVITLERVGTLRGRVLNLAGEPVEGVYVYAMRDDGFAPTTGIFADLRSDAKGEFRMPFLVSGLTYRLNIRSADLSFPKVPDIIVKPGEDRDLGDIKAK